ncbi:MAG: hypothetical protein KA184_08635 [Candidatus Hydrogenedentes bacterium]|nr:hypothetical protein [Candidatus Hydrogenedentota bacterium]
MNTHTPMLTQRPSHKQAQEGMALLIALFFVSVALVLLGGIAVRMINQRTQVDHYEAHKSCFLGLETAYSQCRYELELAEDGFIGLDSWIPPSPGALPSFDDSGVTPAALPSMPGVEYMAMAEQWGDDGKDNNGDGAVDDGAEQWMYTIHGWARVDEKVRQVEAIVAATDVNVWRNAIFGGAGMAGGTINGNVSIHGSVHILGDAVLEGGTSIAAIDLSGTSLIHNNYDGVPADLLARVPPLAKREWNGESDIETLDASLRVKHGRVGMSGNSEVGSADTFGNGFKETMDGTYINDGWTGNAVVPDGDRGDPTSVWSDNGWDDLYDCGDRVSFPLLTDDWRAPLTGARVTNPATGDWYSHQDYFDQVLVAAADNPGDGVYVGDIDLYTMGSHFYWNATTGTKLVGSLPATPPGPNDDYILFNKDTDVLRINGQITVRGNVIMQGKGNQTTINYSGRGAILVHGDVTLDTSLLTCNNGNPASTANSFPVSNIIGIMAEDDMVVGSVAQVSLMGAFYAQDQIVTAKQTHVMGTFVSSYFNMGTNVPNIYQVPSLADNLPLGMIGNFPILSFKQISWREIGVAL